MDCAKGRSFRRRSSLVSNVILNYIFFVSAEKEIIGRIRIDKVEPHTCLWHGDFRTGARNHPQGFKDTECRVHQLRKLEYGKKAEVPMIPGRRSRLAKNLRSGFPTNPPTFGKLGFKFGLGSANYSSSLINEGSVQGSSSVFPQLTVFGEIWINPQWIVRLNIVEGIMSFANPLAGSSPANLNVSYSRYALYGGYNFLLKDDFFGPKIQLLAGLDQTNLFVDASTPLALTSTSYGGLAFGIAGTFPVMLGIERDKYDLGVSLFFHVKPGLSETPQTSGSSTSNSITQFAIFGSQKLGEKVKGGGQPRL